MGQCISLAQENNIERSTVLDICGTAQYYAALENVLSERWDGNVKKRK